MDSTQKAYYFIDLVYRYKHFLLFMTGSHKPVCKKITLTCPDTRRKFSATSCCQVQWYSLGAPLGIGNECWIDPKDIADQCDLYTCYMWNERNNTMDNINGCSTVPDNLLNHYACMIHDMCYVTPGVTKQGCDSTLEENINRIYCDNVNLHERKICSDRASAAKEVLSWTERYFNDSEEERERCQPSDDYATRMWKIAKNKLLLTL